MALAEVLSHIVPLVAGGLALAILAVLGKIIYNVYFHPLAKFPGPKLAACSDIWYAIHWLNGRYPYDIDGLHKQYGDVVRIAVNDLSFASVGSIKTIYGHAHKDKPTFKKSNFYDRPHTGPAIVHIREPAEHREVRKSLSHAFSAAALRDQEQVIMTYVNMFFAHMTKLASSKEEIKINDWYNWLTFDIIGDLAFGESFDAIKTGKGHFWIKLVIGATYFNALGDIFKRMPWFKKLRSLVADDTAFNEGFRKHIAMTKERSDRRISNQAANERIDFFSHLLKKDNSGKDENEVKRFLHANAAILIVAGSETTATFLCGATYYLMKNPEVLQALTKEVRDAFSDASEINSNAVDKLQYLFAVCEEGLRIYPPVSVGLPRESPGATVAGHYVPAGTSISASPWTLTHDSRNFHDPYGFHPERWLPTTHPRYDPVFANDVKEASKPFSTGPRVCIGVNLAYMEMKLILARLVWQFDMEMMNPELDWVNDAKFELLWVKPETRIKLTDIRASKA